MSRMLHRNFKKKVCSCIDCGGNGGIKGRAMEKREWQEEATQAVTDFHVDVTSRNS